MGLRRTAIIFNATTPTVPVRIPAALRQSAGDSVDIQGATVGDVLASLAAAHPGIGDRLFANNTISRFINVYVNDEDIRFLSNLDTPLKDGDDVSIVPAIAGG